MSEKKFRLSPETVLQYRIINNDHFQTDLENLDEVIETTEYDSRAEELVLIAKEMGLL